MPSTGERLRVLAERVGATVLGEGDPLVRDATHDSRQVRPGSLFVAVKGFSVDGHRFIEQAVASGAVAVMTSEEVEAPVPVLVVEDTRAAMGPVAAAIHGDPSRQVPVLGVTGTNGKTTVTHMVEHLLASSGVTIGLVGTIHTRIGGDAIPALHTTPEATDFQRLLRDMIDRGAEAVVVEVSSHALALGRVDATWFEVVAFTNLSQDHLDFHGDMDSYFAAKASLFDPSRTAKGVVWVDDPWGARLVELADVPLVTVGASADVSVQVLDGDLTGTTIELDLGEGGVRLRLPMVGAFNAENAAVASAICRLAGLDPDAIVAGLETMPGVPGRLEVVSGDDPVVVFVDFAHTPDGIGEVIGTLRPLVGGRIIAVVGAGGDRDRDKRPLMGTAASAADVVVVTSDNPRSEDPDAIIDAVMEGVEPTAEVIRLTDRRQAIRRAIDLAAPGDVVVVLGKGHERGQEIAGFKHPFDDRIEARSALVARRGSEG
ncbi:MAG TPA: UDP-N-acetylmuramoyl-L-alanyl-D-glutamate--2,6-diaminopimelate ligase [Acidimicrobiia bacterium]|nr:UDP-N-acetylmuramoyl-L-alanyl-D-glutamate--2,6-diaminopimelate ligase [Acidimicrobiia bacterium]